MALQIANFVSGKIDNVVFYRRAGTYIARSIPAVVKQSAAPKYAAGILVWLLLQVRHCGSYCYRYFPFQKTGACRSGFQAP